MRTRHIALAPLALMLALTLAACSGSGSEGATSATPTDGATSSTPTPTESATTEPSEGASSAPAGCAATDAVVPDGAGIGTTADLDGDGQADQLWLADSADGTRMLGVETASGAVFSTEFSSAAPQAASAIGQVLGDGTAIVLLDTGRAVPLYTVSECSLVPVMNADGDQYTFDKGFTGFGTGVGCEDGDAGLGLVGYLAETEGEDTTVTTTQIDLTDGGTLARNGSSETATDLGSGDALVTAATSVTCGDNAAPVQEPQS